MMQSGHELGSSDVTPPVVLIPNREPIQVPRSIALEIGKLHLRLFCFLHSANWSCPSAVGWSRCRTSCKLRKCQVIRRSYDSR